MSGKGTRSPKRSPSAPSKRLPAKSPKATEVASPRTTERRVGGRTRAVSLDDLPTRHNNDAIEDAADDAFRGAIRQEGYFHVQRLDRHDYGSDGQIEALDDGSPTNFRVHVQLKGTSKATNKDGSVSVEVERTNLNYLLGPFSSLYVCYHLPSRRLLVRDADDVHVQHSHAGYGSHGNVTVRFTDAFDAGYQARVHRYVVAAARSKRDERLRWATATPSSMQLMIRDAPMSLDVPSQPSQAASLLERLYAAGRDDAISAHYAEFGAVLEGDAFNLLTLHMADVNRALNGAPIPVERLETAVARFREAEKAGGITPGSALYCQGNALFALKRHDQAIATYKKALRKRDGAEYAAHCAKNLGSAYEAKRDKMNARRWYERALEINGDLGEAHFALGQWHGKDGNPALAADHLEKVVRRTGSPIQSTTVNGWLAKYLFEAERYDRAFAEVERLIAVAPEAPWIWPWCAQLVAAHTTPEIVQRAERFWVRYLVVHPGTLAAEDELLWCQWERHIASAGDRDESDGGFAGSRPSPRPNRRTRAAYGEFLARVDALVAAGHPDPAKLWDWVGHWAQVDGDWDEALRWLRKAYARKPDRYRSCVATALNHLGRHSSVLRMLTPDRCGDAREWFQLAIARERTGDVSGATDAYYNAIGLEPDYAIAWFNLGGVLWNSGNQIRAVVVWRDAVARFPDNALSAHLRAQFWWTSFFKKATEKKVTAKSPKPGKRARGAEANRRR